MSEKPDLDQLCGDLQQERAELFSLVDGLDETGWSTPTPAPGWSVRDQFAHLAFFDEAARQAIEDPDGFVAHRNDVLADADGFVDEIQARYRDRSGDAVAGWLRQAGDDLVTAALRAGPSVRVPWYGPDMSVASSVTARIMETWAHGQDVADALGVVRAPTERLRHVAFIGYRAFPNSYLSRGLDVPDVPVRVELGGGTVGPRVTFGPDDAGPRVTFGPDDAGNVVRGSLLDFCLVVTQRRHPADTDLTADGPVAAEWLTIAQAFAGPPGQGRQPGQFP